MSYTYKYPHYAVTVDNVIFNFKDKKNPKVLLITRKNDPFKGCYALPGGFLDPEDVDLMSAAKRELFEETNLLGINLYEVCSLSKIGRDPRERVISIVHVGVCNDMDVDKVKAKDDATTISWVPLFSLLSSFSLPPLPLAFDHITVFSKAIKKILENHNYDDEFKLFLQYLYIQFFAK